MEYILLESFEFGICAEMQEYLNGLGEAGILVTAGESRLYRLEEPGL